MQRSVPLFIIQIRFVFKYQPTAESRATPRILCVDRLIFVPVTCQQTEVCALISEQHLFQQ